MGSRRSSSSNPPLGRSDVRSVNDELVGVRVEGRCRLESSLGEQNQNARELSSRGALALFLENVGLTTLDP